MYHQINPTETFRERQLALLGRPRTGAARWLGVARRTPKARSATVAPALGFLAALATSLLLVVFATKPAHAAFPGSNGKIAFQSTRDGNNEIYSMNPGGTEQTNLSNDPKNDTQPVLSPDGNKIAFTSDRDGNEDVYLMDTDPSTNDATNLTDSSSARDIEPTFSPDGQNIAFTSDWAGNDNICKMNVDGSSQKRLTKNPASDRQPTFSPSGKQLAFTSNRDGNENIFRMNAKDGTKQKRLTEDAALDSFPAYSPDGTKIAFQSSRVGSTEIFVMNSDGSNETPITDTSSPTQNRDPDWGVASK